MNATERHLRLLTETTAAVNSTLDLEEVLNLVATKVADALHADACFVYLYDERTDELVLRATHGTAIDELAHSDLARKALGPHIFDRYVELKRKEWDDYRVQLTDWERERYLSVL